MVLQLHASINSSATQEITLDVYPVSDTTWQETTLTYATRPARGATKLGSVNVQGTSKTLYPLDVTRYVRDEKLAGRNAVSFAIVANNVTSGSVFAKIDPFEAGATSPALAIRFDSASGFLWPISASCQRNADVVRYPYGPRRFIGGSNADEYDFHAGIDIPTSNQPPVHAVAGGTVTQGTNSEGAKWVQIAHAGNRHTRYLHLSEIEPSLGGSVQPGQKIGKSGSTGAQFEHLHFTYMFGAGSVGESQSRNPMNILPNTTPLATSASIVNNQFQVTLSVQTSSVNEIALTDTLGTVHSVKYTDIVALGDPARNDQTQGAIWLSVTKPSSYSAGTFTLFAKPTADRVIASAVLRDQAGNVVVNYPP
jgi:murein DD-endopeptidase MepM/ murein hydrolase activator NlpD